MLTFQLWNIFKYHLQPCWYFIRNPSAQFTYTYNIHYY